MKRSPHIARLPNTGPVVVIGAGIGGLSAALLLTAAGRDVTVVERGAAPGGKMRQIDGVDAGPTVLTMRTVFDSLFDAASTTLDAHVTLFRQDILARHWWKGSGPLDLHADRTRSADAVHAFAGARSRDEFLRFCRRAEALFSTFRDPMMHAAEPDTVTLARAVLRRPGLLSAMIPGRSLARALEADFSDPRLRQLFGRYATYVGGSPYRSPAILSLIWHAEESGVWAIDGGMHRLARAIASLIEAHGGRFRYGTEVAQILTDSDGVTGVALSDRSILPAAQVVFNGDPRALSLGRLGGAVEGTLSGLAKKPRSLSAQVWSFRARPKGLDLAHHNVFFCADPEAEFRALERGGLPEETTLYLCAEDRGMLRDPPAEERFEIILNAPPTTRGDVDDKEFETCHRRTFPALSRFGLSFSPEPAKAALTTPSAFDALFPGSAGSLYGQSPHGMFAALERPRARTAIPGLFLCGGGCHPGAGVPMAALSGRHAAEAILMDRTSTSKSRRTAMPGGMSTRSRIAEPAPSRSSGS